MIISNIYIYNYIPMKSHQIPIYIYIPTKWGPQTIAKLVQKTPMSLWFMVRANNYSYWGESKPTYN